MDFVPGDVSGAISLLAGDSRSFCHLSQPSTSGLLLSSGGPSGCGDRHHAPALGSLPGVCIPSVWPPSSISGQGLPLPRPGDDSGGSALATEAVVPRSAGAAGGGSGPSVFAEGSTQTATFPPLPSEPPVLQLTGYRIASDPHVISDSLCEWLANLPGAVAPPPASTARPSG